MNRYKVKCKHCGKEYEVLCSERNFINNKYKHYCSISCRNSHSVSNETKQKISNTLKSKFGVHENKCIFCGQKFNPNGREKFCSETCKTKWKILKTLIKYFGLDPHKIGTNEIFDEINCIKNNLYTDYWIHNLTSTEIATKYNYPKSCNITGKIFKYLDIPTRNPHESNILNIARGKQIPTNYKYKQGWYETWNHHIVFLRSSYEFEFAKYLDEQHIEYEVEKLRIKYFNTKYGEYRTAIPDFFLPSVNTIFEIKSSFTLDVQEMKDKFTAYKKLGYDCKLILDHIETNIDNL